MFRRDAERGEGFGEGFGFEHHAFTAAEGTIIDGAMAVVGEVAQIERFHRHQSLGLGAAHDAVLEDAGEEGWKDGDDVKAHTNR